MTPDELAEQQRNEVLLKFDVAVANKWTDVMRELWDTFLLLKSPEDAQQLRTLFLKHSQEMINLFSQ